MIWIFSFLKTTKKLKMTLSKICLSVDTTLRLLGFTETTKTPGIKYYCKEISRYVWHQTEQFSPHQHNVFTWYCTISSCICPHAATFGYFCSVAPWVSSLQCQWWRKNRIRSDSVRSRYITAYYRIIWVADEVLQSRNFSSEQQSVIFVITYTATCFDYYVHYWLEPATWRGYRDFPR